jgi:hypothetical protein
VPSADAPRAARSRPAERETRIRTGATSSARSSARPSDLCVTCQVRVGRPRATVLRAVVCGPCWAAHGGSPDASEIGPTPTATVPSWDPRDQRHWLEALRRQDRVHEIRADGRAHLLTVARLVALYAAWETLESRPTWERLLARSGLSERRVARWLQELRVRGWLAHLEHGSTPAHRPTVLAHLSGKAQRSGPCHQPQTGLLFLVSGAPEIIPETGRATENSVKPNLLTCENALLWGWWHGPERWAWSRVARLVSAAIRCLLVSIPARRMDRM